MGEVVFSVGAIALFVLLVASIAYNAGHKDGMAFTERLHDEFDPETPDEEVEDDLHDFLTEAENRRVQERIDKRSAEEDREGAEEATEETP